MLKKALRVRKKEDFDRVFRYGKPLFFDNMACRLLAKPSGGFRLGFSLSTKHLPRAVERNRFRRVVSASVEKHPELWPPNTDMIISLRRKMAKPGDLKKMEDIIVTLLSRGASQKRK